MSKPGFRIKDIHAFVVVGRDDEEGICGFYAPGSGGWIPMIAADLTRLMQLKPEAQRIATLTGQTIKLVRFTVREDIEEILP